MSVGYSIHFKSTRTFATFVGGFLAIPYALWCGHLAGDRFRDWAARHGGGWETVAQVLGFGAALLILILLGCAIGHGVAWVGSLLGIATGFNPEQDRRKALEAEKRGHLRGRLHSRTAHLSAAERRKIAKRHRKG
jgi:hypothetical protein